MKTIAWKGSTRTVGAIAFLALVACPWSPPPGSFHEAIDRAKRDREPIVRLNVTDRVWTTAYFFGPYTPNAKIDQVLGFACETCHLIELEKRDDLNAVVLVADNKLVQVQELPRSAADIRPNLLEQPYAAGTTFNLVKDDSGRLWVQSVHAPGR